MCPRKTTTAATRNNLELPKVGLHVVLLLMDFICTCLPALPFPLQPFGGGGNGIVLSTFCYAIRVENTLWHVIKLISFDSCLFENNSIQFECHT